MTQTTQPQQTWGSRDDAWWIGLLGLLLIFLNGVFLLLMFVKFPYTDADTNLGFLSGEASLDLFLLDLLLLFLGLLLVGWMRGRITGAARSAQLVSIVACLTGACSLFVWPLVLANVLGSVDLGRSFTRFEVEGSAFIIGLSQALVGIGGGFLGGRIGSRSGLGTRPTFWWSLFLGLLLIGLNVPLISVLYFSPPYPAPWLSPIQSRIGSEDKDLLWLQACLLIFLIFFVIGVLRGWATRKTSAAVLLAVAACLIGALSLCVLDYVFIGGQDMGDGYGYYVAPIANTMVGGSQVLAGVLGALVGGLIGRYLLRPRTSLAARLMAPASRRLLLLARSVLPRGAAEATLHQDGPAGSRRYK